MVSFLKNSLVWWRASWVYVLIFCMLFSLRVCAINNKTTFFFDDPASLNVSTPNNLSEDGKKIKYGWADLRFDYGKNYTVLEIKKTLFESKSDIKSIISDLTYLHNKTIDIQHPNLYYSILRVWTAGMDYSDSNAIKWRGCSLNLIFFTFSFFFMFKLLNLIKPDKKFVAMGLFFAFVTTGTISNTLLIRPYPMMETFLIAVLYIFVKIFKAINEKEELSYKKIILYGLGMGLFFLSGYYSLFIGLFIFIALCYRCFVMKDIKWLKRVFLIFLIAFGFVYLFCPLYFVNFKSIDHMSETQSQANFWNFLDFHWFGIYMFEFLSKYVFSTIVLYMLLLAMFAIGVPMLGKNRFKREEFRYFLLITVLTFVWSYLICSICPFHEEPAMRYIIIGFPILGLLAAFIVYHLKIGYAFIMILITLLSSAVPILYDINMYNSKYKCLGIMAYFKDYHYLNINSKVYNHLLKTNRPIVTVNKNWIWPNYILQLDNDNIIRFETSVPPKDYMFDDYVLINTESVRVVNNKK